MFAVMYAPWEITFEGKEIRGANADLWRIATSPHRRPFFEKHLRTLAAALCAPDPADRVEHSKALIRAVWADAAVLGPYPFADTLSKFEFDRVFYVRYRDHSCHQLRVYLLGLGIFDNCPQIQDGLDKAGLANDFTQLWAVTSVFHDMGYIVEADNSAAGHPQWQTVQSEYDRLMKLPFSTDGTFGIGSVEEEAVARALNIRPPQLETIGVMLSGGLEAFAEEADRAGLTGQHDLKKSAIVAYFDYAQSHVPNNRPTHFRDHGVSSALLLLRHWRNFSDYIERWTENVDKLERSFPLVPLDRVQALKEQREKFYPLLCRAAGAMSVHNITPSQWSPAQHAEAYALGVNFQNFRIMFADDPKHRARKATPLSFLLGLVDTLQDWDRPTFDDRPNATALHSEDLRVLPHDRKVYVYVRKDDIEFRDPATAERTRYSHLKGVLTSYLDNDMVESLIAWGGELAPQATIDVADAMAYVQSSHLGHRLGISDHEKRVIAKHCVTANFWKASDVVFLEAGTLPIRMIFELYRKRLAGLPQPKRIITNNLACALLAVMNQPPLMWGVKDPYDEPSNLFVLGGRVINDYAGTIPGGQPPPDRSDAELWSEEISGSFDRVLRCLETAEVNHVVMMVTKLDAENGPCARTPWMRRYKKQLLRYVAEHRDPAVRLSILGEADKIYGRGGLPADLEGDTERHWPRLLKDRRVSVISARSADIESYDLANLRETMKKLAEHAEVTLLGPDGESEFHKSPAGA